MRVCCNYVCAICVLGERVRVILTAIVCDSVCLCVCFSLCLCVYICVCVCLYMCLCVYL